MSISLDQIYGAITGYDPSRLQELNIVPSSSTQTFNEVNLAPGMVGFLPITVEAVTGGGTYAGFGAMSPDNGATIIGANQSEPASLWQGSHLFIRNYDGTAHTVKVGVMNQNTVEIRWKDVTISDNTKTDTGLEVSSTDDLFTYSLDGFTGTIYIIDLDSVAIGDNFGFYAANGSEIHGSGYYARTIYLKSFEGKPPFTCVADLSRGGIGAIIPLIVV